MVYYCYPRLEISNSLLGMGDSNRHFSCIKPTENRERVAEEK